MRYLLLLLLIAGCEQASVAQAPVAPVVAPAPVVPLSAEPKPVGRIVPFLDDIRASSELYFGIPAPLPAIVSQVEAESRFNPMARSPAGAQGLLQIMPSTGSWIATQAGFGIAAPFDARWNLRAGIWYLRFLHDRPFAKRANSPCDRYLFSLSAFNGGEGWAQKRQALSKSPGSWAMTGHINPGITEANQRENFSYGPKIIYALQPKYTHLGPLVCK